MNFFFDNLANYKIINILKNKIYVNKCYPFIFFIDDKKKEIRFNKFNAAFELNFNYVYNDNQLQNITNL